MEMQNLSDPILLSSSTLGSSKPDSMAAPTLEGHCGLFTFLFGLGAQSSRQAERRGEEGLSQKQRTSVLGEPSARANGWWGAEVRVPEDGYLPIIVASCQELPTG